MLKVLTPMPRLFRRIGLMVRLASKPSVLQLVQTLANHLNSQGLSVFIAQEEGDDPWIPSYTVISPQVLGQTVDLVIVIGGDGTMLSAARLLAPHHTPMMGINQGRLGFMVDVLPHDMIRSVDTVLSGCFISEARQLISATVLRRKKTIAEGIALNDVVFSRGSMGQMIEFEVFIDQQFVYTQRSDGLIVTTPTGSTAYALAAGGPILHPTLPAFTIVPVSPHSMSYRPIVIGDQSIIEWVLTSGVDACVHFDGQSRVDLKNHDHVLIKRYTHTLKLIHPVGYSYYDMLRGKLHWGKKLLSES